MLASLASSTSCGKYAIIYRSSTDTEWRFEARRRDLIGLAIASRCQRRHLGDGLPEVFQKEGLADDKINAA